MWDTSSFDMGGGGGGGGFEQETNNFESPSSKKKDRPLRIQNVVPLVTRAILECSSEDLNLFGMPVQIASLVGILRNFEVQSTKVTCAIEDFTGTIKAILWLEAENDAVTSLPAVKEGHYVQVFGSVRDQEGEKMIMILKMVPVDDCNVITTHLLDFVYVRVAAEQAAKAEDSTLGLAGPSNSVMSVTDVGTANAVNFSIMGLTPMQEKIFKILRTSAPSDCRGVGRDGVMKHFDRSQTAQVNEALEFLLTEGHAYTTIDNDHFKATD